MRTVIVKLMGPVPGGMHGRSWLSRRRPQEPAGWHPTAWKRKLNRLRKLPSDIVHGSKVMTHLASLLCFGHFEGEPTENIVPANVAHTNQPHEKHDEPETSIKIHDDYLSMLQITNDHFTLG